MKVEGKMRWPIVTYGRKTNGRFVEKTISVRGNPLANLELKPWREEGAVADAPKGYTAEGQGRNHIGYRFKAALKRP